MTKHHLGNGLIVDTKQPGFRAALCGPGTVSMLAYLARRAELRAESISGLEFHSGVDTDSSRSMAAHAWVGASCVNKKTGRPNAGLLKKQSAALSQALHGV